MSTSGMDSNMIFYFPLRVGSVTLPKEYLTSFFNRPGSTILDIKPGIVKGTKIKPYNPPPPPPVGARRSTRLAAIIKPDPQTHWIVAAKIHYPHPMLEIKNDIKRYFGKNLIKETNLTNYNSIITSRLGSAVTFAEPNAPLPVLAANRNNSNGEMNNRNNNGLNNLRNLFTRTAAIGGRMRKQTRRKTRKSKRRVY
jgi:hypothetical protein